MSSSTEHQEHARQNEDDAVLRWRFEQLCELGFDEVEAALLAHTDLDLHRTRALVAAGCSLQLAVEIVL